MYLKGLTSTSILPGNTTLGETPGESHGIPKGETTLLGIDEASREASSLTFYMMQYNGCVSSPSK